MKFTVLRSVKKPSSHQTLRTMLLRTLTSFSPKFSGSGEIAALTHLTGNDSQSRKRSGSTLHGIALLALSAGVLVSAVSPVKAQQIQIPTTGNPTLLENLLPAGSTEFYVDPYDTHDIDGVAIYGSNAQIWKLTNWGNIISERAGVVFDSASTLFNFGTIANHGGDPGGINAGVIMGVAGGTVFNYGLGKILSNSDGIYAENSTTVINDGMIKTNLTGVYFETGDSTFIQSEAGTISNIGGSVTTYGVIVNSGTLSGLNAGTITATGNGSGVLARNDGMMHFKNTGSISGGTGVLLDSIGNILTNAGRITGENGPAISVRNFFNTINLETSSLIDGAIDTTIAAGNTLNLVSGTSSIGTVSNAFTGSGFQFFGVNAAGQTWNLESNNLIITGQSAITAGTLNVSGTDSLFADTTVYSGAALHFTQSGTSNTLATLKVDNGAIATSSAGADFTVTGATTVAGQLTIGGDAIVSGGATVTGGGVLQIGVGGTTGTITGDIVDDGTVIFNRSDSYTYAGLISGAGTVLKLGAGLLKVADDSLRNFFGLTDIQEGTLQIGQYAGDDAAIGGAVRIASGARMGGTGVIHGDVENTGTITALNALSAYGGAGEVSDLTILGKLTNSGTVQLGGSNVGNTLTVNSIVGNGGTFVLNTVLGDDNSKTDRIIVNGGTVTGSSFISIINQGGLGAQTIGNGIQVVVAQNGATTEAGSFSLTNRVAAGAYEYELARGDRSGSGDSWFLRTPTANPTGPINPTDGLRPEIPTNAAIMSLAGEFGYAMLGTLHERAGGAFVNANPSYEERAVHCKDASQKFRCIVRVPVQTGVDSQRFMAGGWARIFADRGLRKEGNFIKHGSDYTYMLGGAQVGLDMFIREARDGSLDKAGLYAGYGDLSADIKGIRGGKAGTVDLTGSSVGAYWTHYAASGWYSDAVVQGTWYTSDARSAKGEQVKPDGFGFLASLEGGYSFKLGSGWTLEPQAQVIYQTLNFENTNDRYGRFSFEDSDSVRTRLGARLARTWNNGTQQSPRLVEAWLRANVWHEFGGEYRMTTATLANTNPFLTSASLGGTWGEIGAGANAQVTDKVNLFATSAYQHSLDGKGRQGWNGRLGVNLKW